MRCDLHVHSIASGPADVALARHVCRESYTEPEALYGRLKARGMHLVTLTDHDSLEGCEALRKYPDFFASEEVTCRMPSGTVAHVAVYDLNERQHTEIQRRARDLPSLAAYLGEQRLLFSLQHPFSALTGARAAEDFRYFSATFPVFETLNGHVLTRNNLQSARFARGACKSAIGGSDAHTLCSLGSAYTEVDGARDKREFLEGIRLGRSRPYGQSGSYGKLTADVLRVVAAMMAECPAKVLLAPLALGVPIATAVSCWQERRFASRWAGVASAGASHGSAPGAQWPHPRRALAWRLPTP